MRFLHRRCHGQKHELAACGSTLSYHLSCHLVACSDGSIGGTLMVPCKALVVIWVREMLIVAYLQQSMSKSEFRRLNGSSELSLPRFILSRTFRRQACIFKACLNPHHIHLSMSAFLHTGAIHHGLSVCRKHEKRRALTICHLMSCNGTSEGVGFPMLPSMAMMMR